MNLSSNSEFYPLGPKNLISDFTKVGQGYKKRVLGVLFGIVLFGIYYLTLLSLAGLALHWAATYDIDNPNRYSIFLKIGLIAMTAMFFLFLLKFIFKKFRFRDPNWVKIKLDDHPKLRDFLDQLIDDVKAPRPKNVYVSHEINASVSYSNPLLSLFFPVKKNLLIGLGLVNSVNLSEFKAIIAHEFGHFSQSSMRLGSYVYIANNIIHSMVYTRDRWDNWLENWKRSDFRLALFAWTLVPFIWLARESMALAYKGLNRIHAGLSKEMEFHADKVAVSVTGSYHIINGLYKLENAQMAQVFALNHMSTAVDHQLYSEDIFFHQTKAFEYLTKTDKDFDKRRITWHNERYKKGFFLYEKENDFTPQMYSSHPSNYLRERNAKEIWLDGEVDERSPWLLFSDPKEIAKKVTKKLTINSFGLKKDTEFASAERVQQFIDDELLEMTYNAKYNGIYDTRVTMLKFPNDIDNFVEQHLDGSKNAKQLVDELYGPVFKLKTDEINQRSKDLEHVGQVLFTDMRPPELNVAGETYPLEKAQELYDTLNQQQESVGDWLNEFDSKVLATYWKLSEGMPEIRSNFTERYAFHCKIAQEYLFFSKSNFQFTELSNELFGREQIDQKIINQYVADADQLTGAVLLKLNELENVTLPKLRNLENYKSVKEYVGKINFPSLSTYELQGEAVHGCSLQLEAILHKMSRLYFKNLGTLLQLQEEIEEHSISII